MSQSEPLDTDLLPAELRARDQWVTWGYRVRRGQTTKLPYLATTTHPGAILASSTDPRTWSTFNKAQDALRRATVGLTPLYNGIGFVFTDQDPYCGVDLDSCRDPQTGALALWARSILRLLRSYSELSPSGKGIHVIVRAHLPQGARHRHTFAAGGRLEAYDHARYFAMTGHHLPWTPRPIQPRQHALCQLLQSLEAACGVRQLVARSCPSAACDPTPHATRHTPHATDDEALQQIAAHPDSPLAQLFAGNIGGYPSHSEADLALCSLLAHWLTRDPDQLDRLFRKSRLYRPKWDSRRRLTTYGQRTLAKALS